MTIRKKKLAVKKKCVFMKHIDTDTFYVLTSNSL